MLAARPVKQVDAASATARRAARRARRGRRCCRSPGRPCATRSSRLICLAMRARASASSIPRWRDEPLDGVSTGTSTTITASNGVLGGDGQQRGVERRRRDRCRARRRCAGRSRSRTAGWTMPLRSAEGGVVGEGDRRQPGTVELAVGADDRRRRSARRAGRAAGCPARCSSWTMASASTITAPRAASRCETTDLPEPMPPVRATSLTRR